MTNGKEDVTEKV